MDFKEITIDVPESHSGRQAEIMWHGSTFDDRFAYGLRLLDEVPPAIRLVGESAVLWLPDGITSVHGMVIAGGTNYDDDPISSRTCWLVVTEDEIRGDEPLS